VAAFFMLAGLFAGAPAVASGVCMPRESLVKELSDKYSEAPIVIAPTNVGVLLEVFASPGGATWTLAITRPDGISCIIMVGENWRKAVPKVVKAPVEYAI